MITKENVYIRLIVPIITLILGLFFQFKSDKILKDPVASPTSEGKYWYGEYSLYSKFFYIVTLLFLLVGIFETKVQK